MASIQSDIDSRVNLALSRYVPQLELNLTKFMPQWLVFALIEFLVFGIKQAWACLFGGLMLFAIIATTYWPDDFFLNRYDFLFLYAISIQAIFLLTKLERPSEAIVILMFHVIGTAMEVFKTYVGSWHYPEEAIFRIGGVPMFSGFMYAAVGSYLARVMRIFSLQFSNYPPILITYLAAFLIYVNFFAHHYVLDIRLGLFVFIGIVFARCQVHYQVWRWTHSMNMLLGFFLVSLFIWLAENIGTISGAWLYPDQHDGWKLVSIAKLGSWYLLMIISFVLVTVVHKPKNYEHCKIKSKTNQVQ